MHRPARYILARRARPAALDEQTAERLLRGALHEDDAPPDYRSVVPVLRAASGPPLEEELAGERSAVAMFTVASRRDGTRGPTNAYRPSRRLTKLVSVKVAMATLITAIAVGGVATAATIGRSAVGLGNAKTIAEVPKRTDGEPVPAQGPDATGAAKERLCRAWVAGHGAEQGSKADATALEALATAAGGAEHIATFCAGASSKPAGSSGEAGKADTSGSGKANGRASNGDSKDARCDAPSTAAGNESAQAGRARAGASQADASDRAGAAGEHPAVPCAGQAGRSGKRAEPSGTSAGQGGYESPSAPETPGADRPDQTRRPANG